MGGSSTLKGAGRKELTAAQREERAAEVTNIRGRN